MGRDIDYIRVVQGPKSVVDGVVTIRLWNFVAIGADSCWNLRGETGDSVVAIVLKNCTGLIRTVLGRFVSGATRLFLNVTVGKVAGSVHGLALLVRVYRNTKLKRDDPC